MSTVQYTTRGAPGVNPAGTKLRILRSPGFITKRRPLSILVWRISSWRFESGLASTPQSIANRASTCSRHLPWEYNAATAALFPSAHSEMTVLGFGQEVRSHEANGCWRAPRTDLSEGSAVGVGLRGDRALAHKQRDQYPCGAPVVLDGAVELRRDAVRQEFAPNPPSFSVGAKQVAHLFPSTRFNVIVSATLKHRASRWQRKARHTLPSGG